MLRQLGRGRLVEDQEEFAAASKNIPRPQAVRREKHRVARGNLYGGGAIIRCECATAFHEIAEFRLLYLADKPSRRALPGAGFSTLIGAGRISTAPNSRDGRADRHGYGEGLYVFQGFEPEFCNCHKLKHSRIDEANAVPVYQTKFA
jgi:hypothetical protein